MEGSRVTDSSVARWRASIETIDGLMFRMAVVGVPLLIAVLSGVALFSWGHYYDQGAGVAVPFRHAAELGTRLPASQAARLLAGIPVVTHVDTRLSEAPVWIAFRAPGAGGARPGPIELPSRHAVALACWDESGSIELGSAVRGVAGGRVSDSKAGFLIDRAGLDEHAGLLCRVQSTGPARVSVLTWAESDYAASVEKFHRNSGLLDGGLLLLALFMLMTALISREWLYVVFAAWLMANLRMAAISAGWDVQWLERAVPPDMVFTLRKITAAGYYTLTVILFSRLFADDLRRVGYRWLFALPMVSCIPLLVAVVALPYARALPMVWGATAISIPILVFFLVRILVITRSKVAMWYSLSLGITLFASFSEVIAAAAGMKGLLGALNSVTAALASSLIAALAVAEQLRQERQQRVRAEAELRSTYDAMPIGLFTLDAGGQIRRGNPALFAMLNTSSADAGGTRWGDFFESGAWTRLNTMLRDRTGQEIEIAGPAGGGEAKRFLVKATCANDLIEGSLQDVTEKAKAVERLRFLAENDPLTRVLNRRGVEIALDRALAGLKAGEPLAIAYLDLDRFKLINDLYGHSAGDDVLVEVCVRIGQMLSYGQSIGRVGGDEFVIVCPGTPIQSAAWTCRGVIERIGTQPYRVGDKAVHVRGSIGLVEVAAGGSAIEVISAADRACREAKSGRGDGLVVYEKTASAFRQREAELRLIERLGSANPHDGLFLEMQPIMSLSAPHDSLNFEVLLRMRESDGSVVPASSIISVAESNGCVGVIDRWVMGTVLAWLDANYDRLKRTQFVCMNLSGASLNDERFMQDACALLAQYVHAAGRLCIEITESVALHDLENTRRFIDRVRGFGAKIALDDFGAGYTSFSYLKELPADMLKIDGNFILGVNSHPANLAIVEAIVSLARNLGMKTVAEWVEDRATVQALAEVGVDYVQGYAVARPQAPAQLLAAASAASFISDEHLARYVRSLHGGADRTMELWDQLEIVKPTDMH